MIEEKEVPVRVTADTQILIHQPWTKKIGTFMLDGCEVGHCSSDGLFFVRIEINDQAEITHIHLREDRTDWWLSQMVDLEKRVESLTAEIKRLAGIE